MHILVVNDDGPPSNQSSPYVHSFVVALQQAGHTVSVCLPHIQRSWIGKAHMIGQTITPSYFRPGNILKDDGITSQQPFNDGKEEWILIDGTPASCAQIGLHHLFKDQGPIDLLISGPNYGRNTTAVFALSSGTIGGAMEGCMSGVRSIALSYAFDTREHDRETIDAASRISTKLIENFAKSWPSDVHLYSINVPLRKGVEQTKIVYTEMIQNRWISGSSFTELSEQSPDADPDSEEHMIREKQDSANIVGRRKQNVKFKWSPVFQDVRSAVERAGKGDGWEVLQGHISVTPLRANFWPLPQYAGEIKLDDFARTLKTTVQAFVRYPDDYVQPLILRALRASGNRIDFNVDSSSPGPSFAPTNILSLQIAAYEDLDFECAAENSKMSLTCAYVIRKALIRKHYLSNTISTWIVKHPNSVLVKHFKPAVHFELDFAEFLDDALVDAWDLNASMERNEAGDGSSQLEWWILKPGMSDGGNGIRLFSTMSELQGIFEEWDPKESEDGDGSDTNELEPQDHKTVMTSQLRHFIAQPYIDPPLLLCSHENRKFHLRVYVVASGALKVFVYRRVLALFAAKPYTSPSSSDGAGAKDISRHITNTCIQNESRHDDVVFEFEALDGQRDNGQMLDNDWQEKIFSQICSITGEVFEAAAREQMVHFQVIPNAFEIFGVDFLVDADCRAWLLELNAYPDFKQTGQDLKDSVVGGLWEEVVKVVVNPFFGDESFQGGTSQLPLVRSLDVGRK